MEEKCTSLANLKPEARNWFVKAMIIEKTPIRTSKWGKQQKLVLKDKENETMQGIIYEQDVHELDALVNIYKTYYIGNAKIREITGSTPTLGSLNHQMILSRSTYIKYVHEKNQLPIDDAYQLTPFAKYPEIADISDKQINLLCIVVHVFTPRFVGKNKRNLQEFVVVNEERRPLILTLWEEFLQTEAPYLTQNVHNRPIILGMRLCVNTFHGLSIGTIPNSTILFEPPIQKAKQLHSWLENNREYVETIVTQKLYNKANQPINQPLSFQIRKISQILSQYETVKSFWIKAHLQIIESDHPLYFLACPDCCRPCGAEYKCEFTCFYCHQDFASPKPLLRFQVDLCDGTGNLRAYTENNEGRLLLGMSSEELIEAEHQQKQFNLADINEKFKDIQFLFQLRTSKNEIRGKLFTRTTIITCLPSSESSSASHSYEEKISSLPIEKTLLPMIESEESTSQAAEKELKTDTTEQHSPIRKRKFVPEENTEQEAAKHAKSQ